MCSSTFNKINEIMRMFYVKTERPRLCSGVGRHGDADPLCWKVSGIDGYFEFFIFFLKHYRSIVS